VRASGISSGFPGLSQSSGQVAHVLRTRSPLGLHRCCHRMDLVRLACIKHAASVRPEPGSNSPSRPSRENPGEIGEPAVGTLIPSGRLAQKQMLSVSVLNFQERRDSARPSGRAGLVARTGFWLSLFRCQGSVRWETDARGQPSEPPSGADGRPVGRGLGSAVCDPVSRTTGRQGEG
jgi:hypothetical protein